MVLCHNFIFANRKVRRGLCSFHDSSNSVAQLGCKRRLVSGFIPNAKKNRRNSRKRSWWQKFFFDDEGNWLGLKDDDMLEDQSEGLSDEELSEGDKFEAWKRRAEAIIELREAQEDMVNEESRRWEDWLVDGTNHVNGPSWSQDWDNGVGESREYVADPTEMVPERGGAESVRDLVLGQEDDDMLYEDRVFRYASLNSVRKYMQLLQLSICECDINIICSYEVLLYMNMHHVNIYGFLLSNAIHLGASSQIIITYQIVEMAN
jgi:hypothetical protein